MNPPVEPQGRMNRPGVHSRAAEVKAAAAEQALRQALRLQRRRDLARAAAGSPVFLHLHAVALHAATSRGLSALDALGEARKVEARLYRPGVVGLLRRSWARLVCILLGHVAVTLSTSSEIDDVDHKITRITRREGCAACGYSREYEKQRTGMRRRNG